MYRDILMRDSVLQPGGTTACGRKKLSTAKFCQLQGDMRSHFPKAFLLTVIAVSLNPLVLTHYLPSIILGTPY